MTYTQKLWVALLVCRGLVCLGLVLLWAGLSIQASANDRPHQTEPTEPATAEAEGRLPGDDTPAMEKCYLTKEELEALEDYENEKIEAALLARSHRLEGVTVTHYCTCRKCCGKDPDHPAYGITASGRKLAPYVSVGVDPEVIPLGSTVIADYGDGELHYYLADDTGSGVGGAHIDLAVTTHQEALELGVREATVYWCEEG